MQNYFSIIIPLFNKEKTITRTLNSILNQTHKLYEVIIVDDGSNDLSFQITSQWLKQNQNNQFIAYRTKNNGVSAARNFGVENSNFDYICFVDADDYWEKDHLSSINSLVDRFHRVVDIFSTSTKYLFNGQIQYQGSKGNNISSKDRVVDYFLKQCVSNSFVNSSSVCIKRKVLRVKKFPSKMKNFEDHVTWARIANSKGIAISPNKTVIYDLDSSHSSSIIGIQNYNLFVEYINEIKIFIPKKKLFIFIFILQNIIYMKHINDSESYNQIIKKIETQYPEIALAVLVQKLFPKNFLKKIRDIKKRRFG